MKRLYRLMDRVFDPLPKELRDESDETGKMLYYEAQDEGYKRYKHLRYRQLILESALAFVLGLLVAFIL